MIFPGWTNDHVTSQNSTVFKDDNLTSYAGHLPEEAFAFEHGPGISKPAGSTIVKRTKFHILLDGLATSS